MTQYERWLKQGNRGTRPCVPRKENIEIKEKYEGNMIKRLVICIIATVLAVGGNRVYAQQDEVPVDSNAVVTNSFWDNWYGQVGVDMWLQNPHGTNFKNVFPNGKTFGVDVALGKWFTPQFGIRGVFNWENGIVKNDYASWVHEGSKGYLVFAGDIMVNLTNLFGDYRPDKKWNVSVFPRAGALLDMLEAGPCGSPMLGLGVDCTYRLNDKWSLFGDASYQMCSSALGFMSGEGSGSNGYFDFVLGVQLDLGNNKFHKATEQTQHYKNAVVTNDFWDNWFVQAGLGMSLINTYGCNFSHVFPNGKTFGINAALGKWITPEFGFRAGVNWQNGIIGNDHLAWLDKADQPGSNHDAGGFVAAYMDVFFNLHNIFGGYDANRRWNAIVFPRLGLGHNPDASDSSPNVGLGTEQTYRLSDRWSLFADVAYQFTSGGFMGDDHSSTHINGASNGWFDINIGVQYELGQVVGWNAYGGQAPCNPHGYSHRGQSPEHNWPRFIVNTIGSVGVAYVGKTALKAMIKEERPDHSDDKSFPSGHAAIAFAAARSIDKEFRKDCIWIPIAGYAAATAVGIERIASDRHHWYDVVAGAAVGYGAAELTWRLSDLCFGKGSNVVVGTSGNTLDVTYNF